MQTITSFNSSLAIDKKVRLDFDSLLKNDPEEELELK
jgi:hypothetical protein